MMHLEEAATALNGQLLGQDIYFSGITTDSRNVQPGDLFIALKGERFDGHQYVDVVMALGAVGVMVESAEAAKNHPAVVVADTRIGLGQLGSYWRKKFDVTLAAVTGSNGKTTVKEMLAAILRRQVGTDDGVWATQGNLNNDIGVPLTLLKLRQQHRYAVIEMGMNHSGEIAYLTKLADPRVAMVNNAHAAHLEGLKTVESVALAKGEIFEGLGPQGIGVINADDPHALVWQNLAAPQKTLTFGLDRPADVSAEFQLAVYGSRLTLHTPIGDINVQLNVPGMHNVRNALGAAAAAIAMGASKEAIATGLSAFAGVKGRLQRKPSRNGATLIDDTYNANPDSVKAAISVLGTSTDTKLLVFGDMGELGPSGPEFHRQIGVFAKEVGVDALFVLGKLSEHAVEGFGAGAEHFSSVENLIAAVEKRLAPDVIVLIKGSRFMQMERIVEALEIPVENQ